MKSYVVSFKSWQVVAVPHEGMESATGIEVWNKAKEGLNAFEWDMEDDYEAEAIELIEEDEDGNEVFVVQPFEHIPSIVAVKVNNGSKSEATET